MFFLQVQFCAQFLNQVSYKFIVNLLLRTWQFVNKINRSLWQSKDATGFSDISIYSQETFTFSKSTKEPLEKGMKYVQN